MRLAILSDAVLPTHPTYGGHGLGKMTLQVAEGLRARGHDVTLFARSGSAFSGDLVMPEDAHGYTGEVALAREVLRMHKQNPFDAVLDNSHIHYLAAQFPQFPTVNVFHDNYQQYRRCPVLLSEGQKALLPQQFERAAVVPNALDPRDYPFSNVPDDYVLFVGALSELKQPFLAIEACAKLGVKLVMAGQTIVGKMPFAGNENTEYVGQVSPAQRNALMRKARVFLQLGNVESFGLTTLEAGLCGTPVVALASGGNVDTVLNGVNGVFAPTYGRNKAQAVADAIESAWLMDRFACREYVEQTFSVERQLDAYEYLLARCTEGAWWV